VRVQLVSQAGRYRGVTYLPSIAASVQPMSLAVGEGLMWRLVAAASLLATPQRSAHRGEGAAIRGSAAQVGQEGGNEGEGQGVGGAGGFWQLWVPRLEGGTAALTVRGATAPTPANTHALGIPVLVFGAHQEVLPLPPLASGAGHR